MDKTGRRRIAGCMLGGLAIAVLTLTALPQRDRTLWEVARRVDTINSVFQEHLWLSDDEMLVLTTDQMASNMVGVFKDVPWQGHAEIWNIVTGSHKPLGGLTHLLNRKDVSPMGTPSLLALSPNGTWLVWSNVKTFVGWPSYGAAHLDGSHYREWSFSRISGIFLDDRHWIEQGTDRPTTPDIIHLVDLQDESQDHAYPIDSPQLRAAIAPYLQQHPYFVTVTPSADSSAETLTTFRTEDADSLWDAQMAMEGQLAPPVRKIALKLPEGFEVSYCSRPSPRQHKIVYVLNGKQMLPIMALLKRMLPGIDVKPIRTESLWVSDADGKNLHEIGHIPVLEKDLKAGALVRSKLSAIEWLPGEDRICFCYAPTQDLYVVSVK